MVKTCVQEPKDDILVPPVLLVGAKPLPASLSEKESFSFPTASPSSSTTPVDPSSLLCYSQVYTSTTAPISSTPTLTSSSYLDASSESSIPALVAPTQSYTSAIVSSSSNPSDSTPMSSTDSFTYALAATTESSTSTLDLESSSYSVSAAKESFLSPTDGDVEDDEEALQLFRNRILLLFLSLSLLTGQY